MARKTIKTERVDLRDLKGNEEFAPKPDPVFQHLLIEAVKGRVPVHFANVAFNRLRRFDTTHRPELTVSGRGYVAQIIAAWRARQPWPMWVYPEDDKFVASDDYFIFAACEQDRRDSVPCLVLGTPNGQGVSILKGPLTVEEIKEALGFT